MHSDIEPLATYNAHPGNAHPELMPLAASDSSDSHDGSEHLVFKQGDALYAVSALAVQEILWLPELTPLAETAPYIVGVINLRGRIVPVMDLSLRLGQGTQEYSLNDCVIVLACEESLLAIIVNGVRSVEVIAPTQIEAVPLQGKAVSVSASCIAGVAKLEDEIVMLLSLDNLLSPLPPVAVSDLPAELAEAPVEMPFTPRFSTTHTDPSEQAIFRDRARRLMPSAETQISGELFPVALVMLHGECYGISLESVREFCELRQVSPVPCCPDYIIGQMNLRGDIVTLLDIQPLLQMPLRSDMEKGNVIVVQHENAPVGIMIDDVADVLYLSEQDVATAPGAMQTTGAKYYCGSIMHDEKVIYLLDLPRILDEGGLVVDEAV